MFTDNKCSEKTVNEANKNNLLNYAIKHIRAT